MEQPLGIDAHASHGWRRMLESPQGFNVWQRISGAETWKRRVIRDYVKPVNGQKILDVGCGTGSVLNLLDKNLKIDYVGCDINPEYIQYARKKYPGQGRFYCCSVDDLPVHESAFDVVLAISIFHHINDQASGRLLQTVRQKLKPGGIFVMTDPVWTEQQSTLEKYLMKRDRGRNIRNEREYLDLIKPYFSLQHSERILNSHYIPWTVSILIGK